MSQTGFVVSVPLPTFIFSFYFHFNFMPMWLLMPQSLRTADAAAFYLGFLFLTLAGVQSRHAKVTQLWAFLISFRHVPAKIGPMASEVAPHVLQLLAGSWGLFRSGW